jgi:uncharacterized membrane protein
MNKKIIFVSILLLAPIIFTIQTSCKHESTYEVCFNTEVLPIIKYNCAVTGCHDATTAEKDIVLDTYENIMTIVEAKNANSSKLYEVLVDNGDDLMPPPPKSALTAAQIRTIRTWIEQGAKNDNCK